jgi:hypothetical protein
MANGSGLTKTHGSGAGTLGPHCPSEVEFEPEVEDSGATRGPPLAAR